MNLAEHAMTFVEGASHLMNGKHKDNKQYAEWVHNTCNAFLTRLRYGKRRHRFMQVREDLRKIRAEAAEKLKKNNSCLRHPWCHGYNYSSADEHVPACPSFNGGPLYRVK